MKIKENLLNPKDKYFKWTDADCFIIVEALGLLIRRLAGQDGERKRHGYIPLHVDALKRLKRLRREIKRQKGNISVTKLSAELIEQYMDKKGVK